jgi:uncharacterized protein
MFKTLSQRRMLLAGLAALPAFSMSRAASQPTPHVALTPQKIVDAARAQIGVTTRYDPRYVQIAYPGGDVPMVGGVCTDVIVRALRALGLDLQTSIHEDMLANFAAYPARAGARQPDRHIDHRRVPNQMTYFARQGFSVPRRAAPLATHVAPGDIVAWDLGNGLKHIGIVSDKSARDWLGRPGAPLIIHNIADGVKEEDVLGMWQVIGHYRVGMVGHRARTR